MRGQGPIPSAGDGTLSVRGMLPRTGFPPFARMTQQSHQSPTIRHGRHTIGREAWLQALFDNASDAILVYPLGHDDRPLPFIEVNDAAVGLYGYSRDDLLAMTVADLLAPRVSAPEALSLLRKNGTHVFLSEHVCRDGRRIPMEVNAHLFEAGGSPTVLAICRDVTRRVLAERDLQLQSRVLEAMTEGVSLSDAAGVIVYTNPAEDRMFGYERGELVGRHVSEQNAYEPDENRRIVAEVMAQLRTHGRWSGEWRNKRKDGTEFVTASDILAFDFDGQTHWLCVQRDVTQRKQIEEELFQSERRFGAFVQHMTDVLWITDAARTKLVYVSPSFEQVFRRPMAELYDDLRRFVDYIHPDDRQRVGGDMTRAWSDAFTAEYRIVRPGGEVAYLRDRAFPIRDEHGHVIYFAGIAEDVTESKAAADELRKLNETLEQRVQARTLEARQRAEQLRRLAVELTRAEHAVRRRLAHTLHDGLQQLLVAAKLRLASTRYKADPAAAIDQAVALIDEAVDVSRSLTVELSPPVLHDGGLGPALEWLGRWVGDRHGLEVEVSFDPQAEPRSEDIKVILFETARELLFNVVKHAGAPRAAVRVARLEPDRVHMVVSDEGAGFLPKPAVATEPGGTTAGFGLLSIRERLAFVGGSLEISSEPGRGTQAVVNAPRLLETQTGALKRADTLILAARDNLSATATSAGTGLEGEAHEIRVLIADDHKILREGLASLLGGEHDIHVVGQASDGAMAVEMAQALSPDVVVMDITMPKMTGIEATRRIRAAVPSVRIIGLSMHTAEDMASALRSAGAEAFLTKGGPAEDLIAAIRGG